MVKNIGQGRKGAPSHTSNFLSLLNFRVPQFLNFHLHIYIYHAGYIPQNIYAAKKQPLIFLYKEFLYSARTVNRDV